MLASIRSYDLPIQIWVVISPFREEIEKPEAYLKVIFRTEHAVSPCFCGPQREVYSPLSSVGLGVADTASFGALPGNVLLHDQSPQHEPIQFASVPEQAASTTTKKDHDPILTCSMASAPWLSKSSASA